MMIKPNVKTYSLGLEELAMALGLINRPDLGRDLLLSIYEKISEEQVDSRLTSASHSLLARGFCGVSNSGTPVLRTDFEQALFPLARFDYVFQMSVVRNDVQVNATVHVRKGKAFTSHTTNMGVIHLLEYGDFKQLVPFFLDVLEEFGGKESISASQTSGKVTLGLLGRALGLGQKQAEIADLLKNEEWGNVGAKNLAEDLTHQIIRATILRVETTNETPIEKVREASKRSILLLQGKKRSWLFEFPSTADSAQGTARLVTREEFAKALTVFVA